MHMLYSRAQIRINAALSLLDDPDADFDQVVAECYGERPSVVRSWL